MSAAGAGLFLGAISGTSMDGLDLALIEATATRIDILYGTTIPIPAELHDRLQRLALNQLGAAEDALDALGTADHQLGHFIGNAALDFLRGCGVDPGRLSAIGSHGQTVRHRPDGPAPFSLQIGDPNQIAEITGITTIADFRRRDMAAGGQGAPLVPAFHAALFPRPAVIVNIGGIGNISVLPESGPVTGFDTGPGNALIDAWILRHRGAPFDAGGAWAATGRVDEALLGLWLAEPYFSRPPPKSTGKEYFNQAWTEQGLAGRSAAAQDVQATLTALTVRTIAAAIDAHAGSGPVIVCGGGRLNDHLMRQLAAALPGRQVTASESLGYGGDWIEAAAFAWLAFRTLQGKPGNEPAATGAAGPRVLGAVYPGK